MTLKVIRIKTVSLCLTQTLHQVCVFEVNGIEMYKLILDI